jgi:hypothetical protein
VTRPPHIPLVVPTAPGPGALAELASVPWDKLAHAYGKGTSRREGRNPFTKETIVMVQNGVDVHLRNLVSEDQQEREEAVSDGLWSTIWHQGTIYEATGYAVPFLAAIAADPAVGTRSSILSALGCILRSALTSPDDPHSERVLQAFGATRAWLDEIAQAGPPPVTRFVELVSIIARDRPPMTDDLFEEVDGAFAEIEHL